MTSLFIAAAQSVAIATACQAYLDRISGKEVVTTKKDDDLAFLKFRFETLIGLSSTEEEKRAIEAFEVFFMRMARITEDPTFILQRLEPWLTWMIHEADTCEAIPLADAIDRLSGPRDEILSYVVEKGGPSVLPKVMAAGKELAGAFG